MCIARGLISVIVKDVQHNYMIMRVCISDAIMLCNYVYLSIQVATVC